MAVEPDEAIAVEFGFVAEAAGGGEEAEEFGAVAFEFEEVGGDEEGGTVAEDGAEPIDRGVGGAADRPPWRAEDGVESGVGERVDGEVRSGFGAEVDGAAESFGAHGELEVAAAEVERADVFGGAFGDPEREECQDFLHALVGALVVERAFDLAAEGETAEGDEEFAMGHHEDASGAFGAAGGVVGVHGVEDADPVAAVDGDWPWVAPVEDGHEFPCGFEGHADGLEVRA